MKKFILNTILFIAVSVSSIALLISVTNHCIQLNAKFKVPDSISKVIIGHSHSGCAFNDSIIRDLKNLSTSGESYFYSYYKVVELLKQNKQINTVFVEFSNNQVSKRMNAWIWEEPYLSTSYLTYAPFMDMESKILLARKNPFDFFNCITLQSSKNLKIVNTKDYDYAEKIGGYINLKKNKIDSLLSYSDLKVDEESEQNGISEVNIIYLKKIIATCNKEKVKIFLIRSPFHDSHPSFKNEKVFQKILRSEFSETEFLDFKNFPLNNSEYADLEHLNYSGAKIFSAFFDKALSNGLLNMKHKQDYLNEVMFTTELK